MGINIVAVGKIKESYLKQGIDEYKKRLSPYTDLQIKELDNEKIPANASKAECKQVKEKEGEAILGYIPKNSYLIALDVKGKPMTSEGLAKSIKNLQIRGHSNITFLIGGPLGLSSKILKTANYRLSLSHLTFPHQMVRLILVEQIYRAFKIIRGEPYHL